MNRHNVDPAGLPGVQERAALRERLRRCLETHWLAKAGSTRGAQPVVVRELWHGLARHGLAALGAEPRRGGLREVTVVMEEIGRAACPVPLLGHLLGNLVLARASARGEPLVDAHVRGRLHGGAMRLTVAFAGAGPRENGTVTFTGGYATGLLHSVDAALQATHLLLCVGDGLLVADLGAPGVSVIGASERTGCDLAQVRLEHVRTDVFPLPATTLADLRLLAGVMLAARQQAAARRTLEVARDAARERRAGVDRDIDGGLAALDVARLKVECAAEAFDFGLPQWRELASGAAWIGADALGAIELPAPSQHEHGTPQQGLPHSLH